MKAAQMPDIAQWPVRGPALMFDAALAPRLAIVVHTEEEFDWGAPFDRSANSVTHVAALDAFQKRANARGYQPHYSCGYPVVQDAAACAFFSPLFASGKATLGTHLHPWVCPPFDEVVNNFNSFPGNLPADLEAAKIKTLTNALEETFGIRPTAYLAGRYGYGANTTGILKALGYTVDFSIAPGWDYRQYDGPNWRDHSAEACFNADAPDLLHVPHSGGHIGFLCRAGLRPIHLDEKGAAGALKLPAIAARIGAIRQARLTIEGMDLKTMKAMASALYSAGVRLFTLSFHSPTAAVGHTPYAQNQDARDALFETMDMFLEYFTSTLGGQSASPDEMYSLASAARGTQRKAA